MVLGVGWIYRGGWSGGARLLCQQSVDSFQPPGGFTWYAYVTRDLPEKVMDFYLQKEGREHAELGIRLGACPRIIAPIFFFL